MLYILLILGLILFIIGLVKDEEFLGGFGLVMHMQYAKSVSELLLPSLLLRILQRFAAEKM